MSFKEISVHIDSTEASLVRIGLALSLAGRFGARLSGLHVIPRPEVPPYFKPSVVERIAEIYTENAREAADLSEALFRRESKDTAVITSWVFEFLLGGTTQDLLERTPIPVLLSR